MPMNSGGLVQIVGQPNLEDVTHARLDCRTGNGPVESPHARAPAGRELPLEFACGEIDGNDFATRRRLRIVIRAGVSRLQIRDVAVGFVAVMLLVDVTLVAMIHDAMACMIYPFVLSMVFH